MGATRILFMTNGLHMNDGWGTVGRELATRLAQSFEVEVISCTGDPDSHFSGLDTGFYYNHIKVGRNLRRILKHLSGTSFNIILSNIEPMLPLAARLKTSLPNAKLIQIGHGTHIHQPFIEWPSRLVMRHYAKKIDHVVVPSRFTQKHLQEWFSGPSSVIPWGVDSEHYKTIGTTPKEKAFVFVGEQKERKGTSTLLRAFSRVLSDHPQARLYLVGRHDNRYRDLCQQLKINSAVVMTGPVSHQELLDYYSRSQAHVLPSINTPTRFEGFGLVHLEANACGLPTIGSSGTANDEVIADGKTGFLCPQNDVETLSTLMKKLLENPSLQAELSSNALAHAQSMTWDLTTKNYSDVIHKLLA